MKRLRCILFHTATALSLLLLIGSALMWPRSRHAIDQISACRDGYNRNGERIRRVFGITSHPNRVEINLGILHDLDFTAVITAATPGFHFSHEPLNSSLFSTHRIRWHHYGLAIADLRTEKNLVVSAHYGWVVFLFSILPAIWLITRLRRRKRISANACPVCGYDLRASPDRCPECGTSRPSGSPQAQG